MVTAVFQASSYGALPSVAIVIPNHCIWCKFLPFCEFYLFFSIFKTSIQPEVNMPCLNAESRTELQFKLIL